MDVGNEDAGRLMVPGSAAAEITRPEIVSAVVPPAWTTVSAKASDAPSPCVLALCRTGDSIVVFSQQAERLRKLCIGLEAAPLRETEHLPTIDGDAVTGTGIVTLTDVERRGARR